jgi:hypothetical protein
MDLKETVRLVCSETGLTHSVEGIEVWNMKVEEVLEKQMEEDPLAVALPALKAEPEVHIGWLSVFCYLEFIAQRMYGAG